MLVDFHMGFKRKPCKIQVRTCIDFITVSLDVSRIFLIRNFIRSQLAVDEDVICKWFYLDFNSKCKSASIDFRWGLNQISIDVRAFFNWVLTRFFHRFLFRFKLISTDFRWGLIRFQLVLRFLIGF